ncbi:hypothetical protein Tco_1501190 [Tanacetum coccineum]
MSDRVAFDLLRDALSAIFGLSNSSNTPRTLIPLRPNLGVLQIGIKSQGYREPEDEEDPERDPADHPVDGRDNDDNESSDDDNDDDDVEKDEEDEDERGAI